MNLHDLDTPAAIIDLDRLERNIFRMAEIARHGGKKLRPHIKTHKTPEIARMQLAAGARGITVAKLGEAEVFTDAGFTDVFMANQVVGEQKIERLIALQMRARLAIGVDSVEAAIPISDAALRAGVTVPVRIEIDTGTGRAGIRNVAAAVELGQKIAVLQGLEIEGLFTYEGAVSKAPESEREWACAGAIGKLVEISDGLARSGVPIREISVGSTPGASLMAKQNAVTELRPGTYVFLDYMQTGWGASLEDCALTVLTTVISRPDAETAIIDGGTKTFSGDKAMEGSKHGLVVDDPAVVFDWANEEHGHLDLRAATLQPKIGDKLRIVPWHVCTCVNMHETLHGVRGENVEAVWNIAARGKIR